MDIRVVLVRPEHDMNVGSVCRAMKNFGFYDLAIVCPQCKLGFEAKMYAKHSEEVLADAKISKALSQAVQGCDLVIGTTGIADRFHKSIFKKCVPISKIFQKSKGLKRVAIVFGAESSGLSEEDSDLCDLMATIPTAPDHRVLNLSHAAAVTLYQVFTDMSSKEPKLGGREFSKAEQRQLDKLEELFISAVKVSPTVRDKKKVGAAFRRIIKRAVLSEEEAGTLLCAFDSFEKAEKERHDIGGNGKGIKESK